VREEDGQSRLGCKYVSVPPWSVQLRFG
jgi:hypothetical protein